VQGFRLFLPIETKIKIGKPVNQNFDRLECDYGSGPYQAYENGDEKMVTIQHPLAKQ
jgi:hypothetical protein